MPIISSTIGSYAFGRMPLSSRIVVQPSSIDFGGTAIEWNRTANVVITNTSSTNLSISGLTLEDNTSNVYTVMGCADAILPGQSCTLAVKFAPALEGTYNATLSIQHNLSDDPYTVPITGRGQIPGGLNWKLSSFPAAGPTTAGAGAIDVTFGAGKFIAIRRGTNVGFISTDGVVWQAITLPAVQGWRKIVYGNGLFVLAGLKESSSSPDATMFYSIDGINWNPITLPEITNVLVLAHGGTGFIASGTLVGTSTVIWKTYTSLDGINWTTVSNASLAAGLVYGNNIWLSFSTSPSFYRTSVDAITWVNRSFPGSGTGQGYPVFGQSKFVVARSEPRVYVSTDGTSWSTYPAPSRTGPIAYGPGKFVSIVPPTELGDAVMASPNGINWDTSGLPRVSGNRWRSIVYGAGYFVAVGDSAVAYSD